MCIFNIESKWFLIFFRARPHQEAASMVGRWEIFLSFFFFNLSYYVFQENIVELVMPKFLFFFFFFWQN